MKENNKNKARRNERSPEFNIWKSLSVFLAIAFVMSGLMVMIGTLNNVGKRFKPVDWLIKIEGV